MRSEEFDNARPPAFQTEIPIFALALVIGSKPHREWLVYANAPRRARVGVKITLPDYGVITVDVPQSGSFYHVSEKGKQVQAVVKGGPASFRLAAPRFLEVGAEGAFETAEKYSPSGTIESVHWDLGDGSRSTGDRVTHRYAKPGQYLVGVTGFQGAAEVVRQQVPVFVGLKPEEGFVCRLLMKGALEKGMKSWIWLSDWDKVDYHFIPDASGKENIGFLAGGAWESDPQRGTVLALDGRHDRVEIAGSPEINTGGPYPNRTIALWFRARDPKEPQTPARKTPPKDRQQVLYEEGGPGSGMNLYLDNDVLFAGAWNQGKGTWLSSKKLTWDDWHHVALVLRGKKANDPEVALELYLDGQRVAQGKAPLVGAHSGDINLGRCGNTLFHDGRAVDQPDHYFAGRIDDFQIANRSLAPEEVRALANAR